MNKLFTNQDYIVVAVNLENAKSIWLTKTEGLLLEGWEDNWQELSDTQMLWLGEPMWLGKPTCVESKTCAEWSLILKAGTILLPS